VTPPPSAPYHYEARAWKTGVTRLAGIDEAGRGPLAGPVVAAAVIIGPERRIKGLADSKLLTAEQRDALFLVISERAVAIGVGIVDHQTIDRINILQATRLAMTEAVARLAVEPDLIITDFVALRECRGRLDHRQGDARPPHARGRSHLPRVRLRPPQGLRDAGASRRPRPLGAVPAAPAHLRRRLASG